MQNEGQFRKDEELDAAFRKLSADGKLYNESKKKTILWHHRLNSWIILNLSSLNAYLFFIIVLFCAIFSSAIATFSKVDLGAFSGFLLGAIGGCMIGFIYCGFFSIVITLSKDISRIANSLEEKGASQCKTKNESMV